MSLVVNSLFLLRRTIFVSPLTAQVRIERLSVNHPWRNGDNRHQILNHKGISPNPYLIYLPSALYHPLCFILPSLILSNCIISLFLFFDNSAFCQPNNIPKLRSFLYSPYIILFCTTPASFTLPSPSISTSEAANPNFRLSYRPIKVPWDVKEFHISNTTPYL